MASRFQLGLVSNCWLRQLAAGATISQLIPPATKLGLTHFELRQGALGEYEDEQLLPISERLEELGHSFPDCSFDLAIAYPFFDPSLASDTELFQRSVQAVKRLSNQPHLRLVDLATRLAEQPDGVPLATRAAHVSQLALTLYDAGGLLSIENAMFQPWPLLWDLFRACQDKLGSKADCLKLCYDPCNLFPQESHLAATATRQLNSQDMSMLHFKQRTTNGVATTLCDGPVDWSDQLQAVAEMDYRGLGLFEVTAEDGFWDNLQTSLDYLAALEKSCGP